MNGQDSSQENGNGAVRVAGYELLERVGRGGMGTVYKARQTSLRRIVALKVLSSRLSSRPEFLRRFQREARLAARLNHPNIAQVYDVGESEGIHYLAMEFVPGESLSRRVTRRGPLSEDEIIAVGKAVAEALIGIDEAGIVHRDIKPSNILLTESGDVKLVDLGLAREAMPGQVGYTRAHRALGTPSYMSPEQAMGVGHLDIRSDIYSLGATLYFAATSRPPFTGDSKLDVMRQQVERPPVPVDQVNPAIAPDFAAAIMRMLEKSVARRYQFPRQLRAALVELEEARRAARRRVLRPVLERWRGAVFRGGQAVGTVLAWLLVVPATFCIIVSYFCAPVLLPLIWLMPLPGAVKLWATLVLAGANPFLWRGVGALWQRVSGAAGWPRGARGGGAQP